MIAVKMDMLGIPRLSAEEMGEVAQDAARSVRVVVRRNFMQLATTIFHSFENYRLCDLILRAYHQAVAEKYRFFSYGDCMLIL